MLARRFGEKLPKSHHIKGYSSPAERCVETADLVMSGHAESGGEVSRNRVMEALGVFYALDQMKMFMAMQDAGGLVAFLNQWFDGKVGHDVLMPPDTAANILGRIAATRLAEAPEQPRIDLLVSHDFTVYTLKDRLLGQTTDRYPDVHYLDGIAFFLQDGQVFAKSHHEPAIKLEV